MLKMKDNTYNTSFVSNWTCMFITCCSRHLLLYYVARLSLKRNRGVTILVKWWDVWLDLKEGELQLCCILWFVTDYLSILVYQVVHFVKKSTFWSKCTPEISPVTSSWFWQKVEKCWKGNYQGVAVSTR